VSVTANVVEAVHPNADHLIVTSKYAHNLLRRWAEIKLKELQIAQQPRE